MDAPARVTQEEGHTRLLHLPSAVHALVLIARRVQAYLTPSSVKSNFVYPRINRSPLVGNAFFFSFFSYFVFARKQPSSCHCTEIRTHVPTLEGFEVTN